MGESSDESEGREGTDNTASSSEGADPGSRPKRRALEDVGFSPAEAADEYRVNTPGDDGVWEAGGPADDYPVRRPGDDGASEGVATADDYRPSQPAPEEYPTSTNQDRQPIDDFHSSDKSLPGFSDAELGKLVTP